MNGKICQNCCVQGDWTPAFGCHDLVICSECGGWSYIGAVATSVEELYDRSYFEEGEYAGYLGSAPVHKLNFQRKIRKLFKSGVPLGSKTRLLELGAATGEFLRAAREAGAGNMLGLEPSEYARRIATDAGLAVIAETGTASEAAVRALEPNYVAAWDVWEHLREPGTVFDRVFEACSSSVTVALTTVDASSAVARLRKTQWRQYHPPTHLHYPTRRSLTRFFESRGFRILHHGSFGSYRPVVEYLRVLRIADVKQFRRFHYRGLYVNLFDTQLLIAAR